MYKMVKKMNMNIKRMKNASTNIDPDPPCSPLELHKLKTGAINSYDAAKSKEPKNQSY
jgi:hypothetical protein